MSEVEASADGEGKPQEQQVDHPEDPTNSVVSRNLNSCFYSSLRKAQKPSGSQEKRKPYSLKRLLGFSPQPWSFSQAYMALGKHKYYRDRHFGLRMK